MAMLIPRLWNIYKPLFPMNGTGEKERCGRKSLAAIMRHFLVLLVCLFCTHSSTFADPVSVTWGKPSWTSATHVRIPVVVKIDEGWKISGDVLNPGEIGQPTTFTWENSTNIWHVQAHWPEPTAPDSALGSTSQATAPDSTANPAASQFTADKTGQSSVYRHTFPIQLDIALKDRSAGQITLVMQGLACSTVCQPFEITLPPYALNPPSMTWWDWWVMLGCAFLGGLILNIMPCVLPVLALKLKGLTQKGSGAMKTMCAVTASGILCGFWALALLTVVLKTFFQQQVGWGMHLQNPYFVTVMIVLMMFGGCGLLGVFHINAPQWAGRMLAPSEGRSLYMQSFLSGLIAVLLATPCSAPFLGTALGFALTGQGMEIFVFYTAIALGFALPYILGMIFPIHKLLPRPGMWMVTFEKILGGILLISAGWFVRYSLGGLLGVPWDQWAMGIWAIWAMLPLLSRLKGLVQSPGIYRVVIYALPGVLSIILMVLPALPGPVEHPISMQDGAISWQVFSSAALERGLAKGQTVVVDLTGRACALCLVNKSVFKHATIQKILIEKNRLCLRGDLTRADPALMMFLRKYGRSAIPFNLVIHANHPKGVVLSENLTVSDLLHAVAFVETPETPASQEAGGVTQK